MIILPDRGVGHAKFLLPIPKREWRTPSQAQEKNSLGHENQTRFRARALTHDGVPRWIGFFDDRTDFDAFLWGIADDTLKWDRALWDLTAETWMPGYGWSNVGWRPDLDEGLLYDFVTLTYRTSTGSFTVPSDCTGVSGKSGEFIDAIGPGGGGGKCAFATTAGGGGGGGCSRVTSLSMTPGATAYAQVGAGGAARTTNGAGNSGTADTWLNKTSNAAPGSTSNGVLAKLGAGGPFSTGTAAGGAAGSGVGSTKYSGGNGGASDSGGYPGGGGGAAGPNGNGNAGANGNGATGGNGGSSDAGSGGAASEGSRIHHHAGQMILDQFGTEYRSGRIRLSKDWIFRPAGTRQWWEPSTEDSRHYLIRAYALIGDRHQIVWQGNFFDLAKAISFWQSLHDGIGPVPHEWDVPVPSWYPGLNVPGIVYDFATIENFTTVTTTTWTRPSGVPTTDYLVVGGGGSGGGDNSGNAAAGGGGGGGGLATATGLAVPDKTYSVTVGAKGATATSGGNPGGSSTFGSITVNGGGGGGYWGALTGDSGGCGGGGGSNTGGGGGGGSATGTGSGNAGGSGVTWSGSGAGGGGGGRGGAAGNASGGTGGTGGAGTANSMTGSSVTYCAGGGGGGSTTAGTGGTNAGSGGSLFTANGTAASLANCGAGGGGGSGSGGGRAHQGGAGSDGRVTLSYTVYPFSFIRFRRTTRFFTRSF